MRSRSLCIIGAGIVMAIALAGRDALGQQGPGYSLADLMLMLRGGDQPSAVAALAAQSCISFNVDSTATARLRQAGADSTMLARLRSVCRRPSATQRSTIGTVREIVPGATYFDFQVEKQAAPMPSNRAPRFPDSLRVEKVVGEVLVQFTVDTLGQAEMRTLKVLKSTHDLFTNAVKAALPAMRFYPAEIGGRPVKQLMQMPFQFSLSK